MKKLQKRKLLSWRIYSLLIIACTLFITYACSNEDCEKTSENNVIGDSEKGNEELTIKAAKDWYGQNCDSIVSIKVINDLDGTLVKLDWSQAQEYNNERFEVVEAPLKTKQPILLLDKEAKVRIDWEKDKDKIRNLARMVIVKDLEANKINHFAMIYIGSYDYMLTSQTFLKNNYLSLETDYTGTVLFIKPNAGIIDGKIYENGKLTKTILPNATSDNIQLRSGSDNCWLQMEFYQAESCSIYEDPYDPSYIYSYKYHQSILKCEEDQWGSWVTICEGIPYEPLPEDNSPGGAEPKPGPNPVQVGPCTLTEWDFDDEIPSKYYSRGFETFAKNNLPATMERQSYKTCITALMEYMNHHVYKKNNKTKSYYNSEYVRVYNEDIPDGGIENSKVFGFVNKHFRTARYSSIQSAINLGCVVMLDFYDSWTYGDPVYPVLVIGYQPNGNLIYMDPIHGELYTITEPYFHRRYIICIYTDR